MKTRYIFLMTLVLLLTLSSLAGLARAYQATYSLDWWTVDAGGDTCSGHGYTLAGTLGQPEAGTHSTGSGYTLAGGFWHDGGAAQETTKIFLPVVVR
jgi:hypothetical protein